MNQRTVAEPSRPTEGLYRYLESFCIFIGYPRSGHSLVGSLVDAHPNAVVAHELDVLQEIDQESDRTEIFDRILANAERFGRDGRSWSGYDYTVPNGRNGQFETIRLLGDKKAGKSTGRIAEDPTLLPRLRATVGVPLKLIHVVRNPFDNITTISRRSDRELEWGIEYYFFLTSTVTEILASVDIEPCFELRHEELIARPREVLAELVEFLGLPRDDGHLDDSSSIVYAKSNQSRHDGPWTPELISRVQTEMQRFSFLQSYSFDS